MFWNKLSDMYWNMKIKRFEKECLESEARWPKPSEEKERGRLSKFIIKNGSPNCTDCRHMIAKEDTVFLCGASGFNKTKNVYSGYDCFVAWNSDKEKNSD